MKLILNEGNQVYRRYYNQYKRLDLLEKLNKISKTTDKQKRGYLLQAYLNDLFRFYDIKVTNSFTRNDGGEQIDGAYMDSAWSVLVECRWRKKLADIRDMDGLYGQIGRSGVSAKGLFLSMTGWSGKAEGLLKQNPNKVIMLMNGDDIKEALEKRIDIKDFLGSVTYFV